MYVSVFPTKQIIILASDLKEHPYLIKEMTYLSHMVVHASLCHLPQGEGSHLKGLSAIFSVRAIMVHSPQHTEVDFKETKYDITKC